MQRQQKILIIIMMSEAPEMHFGNKLPINLTVEIPIERFAIPLSKAQVKELKECRMNYRHVLSTADHCMRLFLNENPNLRPHLHDQMENCFLRRICRLDDWINRITFTLRKNEELKLKKFRSKRSPVAQPEILGGLVGSINYEKSQT